MAFTFCLMSPKGGVGKTTTAMIIASEAARLGKTVALIEADPNGHLQRWFDQGRATDRVHCIFDLEQDGSTIAKNIITAQEQYDYVIIDTEGTDNERAFLAAHHADIVIIPMQFSAMDLSGAIDAMGRLDAIEDALGYDIIRTILPTKVSAAIRPASQVQTEVQLAKAGISVINPGIIEKDAFRLLAANGCLLHDLPKYTNVANIQTAIDNIQAVFGSIAQFYQRATSEEHDNE